MNAPAGAVPVPARAPSRRERSIADRLAERNARLNLLDPQWRANPYDFSVGVGACYDPNPLEVNAPCSGRHPVPDTFMAFNYIRFSIYIETAPAANTRFRLC